MFFVPKADIHYSTDTLIPGTQGFYPKIKAKAFRRGIQTELLIQEARGVDQSAVDALLASFYQLTPFDVGAGPNGQGGAVDPNSTRLTSPRSYISGVNTKRPQDEISSDDYVALERQLLDIVEP